MITARAILPGKFNASVFANFFRAELLDLRREIAHDFRQTTATWNHKPHFQEEITQSDDETKVGVFVEGHNSRPRSPEDIYCILAAGTSKRYAVMTPGFSPKTRTRVIDSFAGSGGFSHLDMNEARAHSRAIQAREWDIAIATKHKQRVVHRLKVAIRNAVTTSGHEV